MTQQYTLPKSRGADNNGFGRMMSNVIYDCRLTSGGGEKTLTVPGGNQAGLSPREPTNDYLAIISMDYGATVSFSLNATAAGAPGASFATSDEVPVQHGDAFYVKAGDVMHFITNDTSVDISVSFYS